MDLAPKPPAPHDTHQQPQFTAAPPVVSSRSGMMKGMFSRTSGAFTAEYSVFLIALGVVLSNLAGLIYIFFGLIVDSMNGGATSSLLPTSMFALWLIVSSAVAAPIAVALWSRIQGELTNNDEFKGDLPKGAAKGFRTFWIILSALSIVGLLMAAIYAPIAAAVSNTNPGMMLVAVTLPSLINAAVLATGVYLVTRPLHQRGKARLLVWIVVALTAVLFIVDYAWASNMKTQTPSRTPRTTVPSNDYDAYDDLYDDTYYDYSNPNTLYR
jgi:hypothetical protein